MLLILQPTSKVHVTCTCKLHDRRELQLNDILVKRTTPCLFCQIFGRTCICVSYMSYKALVSESYASICSGHSCVGPRRGHIKRTSNWDVASNMLLSAPKSAIDLRAE